MPFLIVPTVAVPHDRVGVSHIVVQTLVVPLRPDYLDKSRLDGERGQFSACLPTSVKIRFSAPTCIVLPKSILRRENILHGTSSENAFNFS